MLAFLHEQKLPVLSSRACERVAYRRAIGEGAIVQELGKDPSSSHEMEAFLAEVTA
jgi:chromosome partitioning protein